MYTRAAISDSPQIAVPFGKYKLLKRLAVGGMAELFLATDSQTQGLVAIKRILPYLSGEEEFVRMFLSEARIAAQLDHPNIVQVFELGKLEESIFLAMEYVEGTDLRRILNQQTKVGINMPYGVAARVVADVCKGLYYAHNSQGVEGRALEIVHRDVSPQNVMVAFDGRVKLVDFGIAKANAYMEASKPGVIKGKFLYLSPEQVVQDRVDHRADLFAIGTLLYEITTGRSPFLKPTSEAVIYAIKTEDPAPPQRLRGDYPEALRRIVFKCLEKDRIRRYSQASDIAADLEAFLDETDRTDAGMVSAYLGELYGKEDERTLLHIPRTKHPPPLPPSPAYVPRAYVVATPVLEPMPRRMTGESPRYTAGSPSTMPPPSPVDFTLSGSDVRTSTVSAATANLGAKQVASPALTPAREGALPPVSEDEGPTTSLRPKKELPAEVSTRRERPPELPAPTRERLPPPVPPRLEDLEAYAPDSESELTELAQGGAAEAILRELAERSSGVTTPRVLSPASGRSSERRPASDSHAAVPEASSVGVKGPGRSQRTSSPSRPTGSAGTPGKGVSSPRRTPPNDERTRTFVGELTHSGITFVRRRLRSTMAVWAIAGAFVAVIVVSLYRLTCEAEPPHPAIVSRQVPATATPPPPSKALAGPNNAQVVFQAPKGTLILAHGEALALDSAHAVAVGTLHFTVLCPGASSQSPRTAEVPPSSERPTVVVVGCEPKPAKE